MMETIIKEIPKELRTEAIQIFSESFIDDPLFLFAFPQEGQRKRLTKIMYEFVVYDIVPKLNLTINGYYIDNKLAGCNIYTTPESKQWNDAMNESLMGMKEKANDKRIDIIGEYARLEGYDPGVQHFYGNELAVKKEYRNKGIGKALTELIMEQCKKHPSAKGVIIDTANEKNVHLYEKWGWELKKEVNFYSIKKYFLWKEK